MHTNVAEENRLKHAECGILPDKLFKAPTGAQRAVREPHERANFDALKSFEQKLYLKVIE